MPVAYLYAELRTGLLTPEQIVGLEQLSLQHGIKQTADKVRPSADGLRVLVQLPVTMTHLLPPEVVIQWIAADSIFPYTDNPANGYTVPTGEE